MNLILRVVTILIVACVGAGSLFSAEADPAALLKKLHDADEANRLAAVQGLLEMRAKDAASKEALAEAGKNDPSNTVRSMASLALRRLNVDVPEQIAALTGEDKRKRFKAIKLLGFAGPAAVDGVPALIGALKDKDIQMRHIVADAICEIGPGAKQAIPELIALLKTDGLSVLRGLPNMGAAAREAVPALLPYVWTDDFNSTQAVSLLSQIGFDDFAALLEKFKDSDPKVRARAVAALGAFGDKARDCVPGVIAALDDKDPAVRFHAVETLGRIGAESEAARSALVKTFRTGDAATKAQVPHAFRLMSSSGKPKMDLLPILIESLSDSQTAEEATTALSAFGESAVPALLAALLKEPKTDTRKAIIWALGDACTTSKDALAAVLQAMSDPDPALRMMAARAIWKSKTPLKDAVPALIKMLSDKDDTVRVQAMETLAAAGTISAEATPALLALLRDANLRVSSGASSALARLGTDPVLLIPFMKDADAGVRQRAINAIPRGAATPETTAALIERLKDPESKVRVSAAGVLYACGPSAKTAAPALLELIHDAGPDVRATAILALSAVDPASEASLKAFTELEKDPDSRVKNAAQQAILRAKGAGPAKYGKE